MKLSAEARSVLETSMEYIEDIVAAMPDDRVLLYKNVVSNPIGDLPRYSIHIRIQHMLNISGRHH